MVGGEPVHRAQHKYHQYHVLHLQQIQLQLVQEDRCQYQCNNYLQPQVSNNQPMISGATQSGFHFLQEHINFPSDTSVEFDPHKLINSNKQIKILDLIP